MKKIIEKSWFLPLIVLFLATLVRLYVLFFVTDPQNPGVGWYPDTYHHWQIAYLTKEIGLAKGRLWDLKGMEYFWGIGHPLILIILFTLTGSVDILVPRLLTVFSGALFTVFLYVIVKRYWGKQVGLATALFAIFSPVAVFTDVSGMQPPVGWLFLILGFYFWPKSPFLTGLFWALSGTIRAEFWLISAALVVLALFYEKDFDRWVILLLSYLVFSGLHMKILFDKTGNPLYPIYWNYRGNIVGEWVGQEPGQWVLTPLMEKIRLICWPIFIGCGVMMIYLWRKRQVKARLFFAWGLLNIGFLAGVASLGDFILYYAMPDFWISRFFSWPYTFLGLILILFLFVWLPKRFAFWQKLRMFNWVLLFLVIIIFSSATWPAILNQYRKDESDWQRNIKEAKLVGSFYQEGSILVPADRPDFVYALVKYGGIKGRDIRGDMFDPFYYFKEDPWENWPKAREEVLGWLRQEGVKLILTYPKGKYKMVADKEKESFQFLGTGGLTEIYKVKL